MVDPQIAFEELQNSYFARIVADQERTIVDKSESFKERIERLEHEIKIVEDATARIKEILDSFQQDAQLKAFLTKETQEIVVKHEEIVKLLTTRPQVEIDNNLRIVNDLKQKVRQEIKIIQEFQNKRISSIYADTPIIPANTKLEVRNMKQGQPFGDWPEDWQNQKYKQLTEIEIKNNAVGNVITGMSLKFDDGTSNNFKGQNPQNYHVATLVFDKDAVIKKIKTWQYSNDCPWLTGIQFICQNNNHNQKWTTVDNSYKINVKTVEFPQDHGIIGIYGDQTGNCGHFSNLGFIVAHKNNT